MHHMCKLPARLLRNLTVSSRRLGHLGEHRASLHPIRRLPATSIVRRDPTPHLQRGRKPVVRDHRGTDA